MNTKEKPPYGGFVVSGIVYIVMKVKSKLGVGYMIKVTDELFKLGFYGGKLRDSKKGKVEFYYDRKVWGELIWDPKTLSVSRVLSRTEFSLSVTYDERLNSIEWEYGSEDERDKSFSKGLHLKIELLLG